MLLILKILGRSLLGRGLFHRITEGKKKKSSWQRKTEEEPENGEEEPENKGKQSQHAGTLGKHSIRMVTSKIGI